MFRLNSQINKEQFAYANAMLRHADVFNYIDDMKLNQNFGNTWDLPDNLYDATGVFGFVEFVTPESNIKEV